MRHRKNFNHLGRKSAHRKAMLSNMASSLILHKRIKTTVPKAKALRVYVEPLINRSKDNTTHSRRIVFSYLQNKEAVTELFRTVSDKVADRPGGYTRILKIGSRMGDNAEMCYIELVDFNENLLNTNEPKKKPTTRRSRRSSSKKEVVENEAATTKEEAQDQATVESKEKPAAKEKVKKDQEEVESSVEKAPKASKEGKDSSSESQAEKTTDTVSESEKDVDKESNSDVDSKKE